MSQRFMIVRRIMAHLVPSMSNASELAVALACSRLAFQETT